jgi:hypothetical protein
MQYVQWNKLHRYVTTKTLRRNPVNTGDSRYTRFRCPLFRNPRFYFSIMRSSNILSAAKFQSERRTFSRLIRECDTDDKFGINKFWRQFNIKMANVIRFPFYAFSLYAAIRRTQTRCMMWVACSLQVICKESSPLWCIMYELWSEHTEGYDIDHFSFHDNITYRSRPWYSAPALYSGGPGAVSLPRGRLSFFVVFIMRQIRTDYF